MKVNNMRTLLLTVACVGISSGHLLHANKPSLSAVKGAQNIGQLFIIINANNPNMNSNFFAEAGKKLPKIDLTDPVGALQQDPAQIAAIKDAYATGFYKNVATQMAKRSATFKTAVDNYAAYLLYFMYNGQKIYINNPMPDPRNIEGIMIKWTN